MLRRLTAPLALAVVVAQAAAGETGDPAVRRAEDAAVRAERAAERAEAAAARVEAAAARLERLAESLDAPRPPRQRPIR
jgi:hypothetical protein